MTGRSADTTHCPSASDYERFFKKVLIFASSGCWEWQSVRMPFGYGQFGGKLANGRNQMLYAHRVSYTWFHGAIPTGLTIDHLCANPCCVNPEHLEAVTGAENTRRACARRTHCKHGHEFTPENTYRSKTRTRRECRACNARRTRELRVRRNGMAVA